MMKNKKITITIFVSLVIVIFNINKVKGCTLNCFGGGNGPTSSGDTSGSTGNYSGSYNGPGTAYDCGEGLTATCGSSVTVAFSGGTTIEMYDIYGNKIDNPLNISNTNILAGTYVGLNVYETKSYSVEVKSWANGIQEYHDCRKWVYCDCTYWDPAKKRWIPCDCSHWEYINDVKGTSCPSGYNSYNTEYKGAAACSGAYSKCRGLAASQAKASAPVLKPSYQAEYRKSNDIEGKEPPISASSNPLDIEDNTIDNYYKLIRKATFYYNRGRVCIDVKTGDVEYTTGQCDKNRQHTIDPIIKEDGNFYWKYFIPLNTNSSQGFSFSLVSNKQGENLVIDPFTCMSVIAQNDNFQDTLEVASGKSFDSLEKIINGMSDKKKELIKQQAINWVKNAGGCYFKAKIDIPVIQRFYNEKDNGINFKGFNFYYKPIDINNPFPNGLNDTSIWYDWKKDTDKEPDISESYKNLTYYANTSEYANWIRNDYSKTAYPYTSWKLMNLDGTSQFVRKNGIMDEKKVKLPHEKLIYNLGCGPWNEKQTNEDGSKNYFYQPECGKK